MAQAEERRRDQWRKALVSMQELVNIGNATGVLFREGIISKESWHRSLRAYVKQHPELAELMKMLSMDQLAATREPLKVIE
jgi:hypothetical protein